MNRRSFWKGLILAPLGLLIGKPVWPWSDEEEMVSVPMSVLSNAARAAKACSMFNTPMGRAEARELLSKIERLGKITVKAEISGTPVRPADVHYGWNLVVY